MADLLYLVLTVVAFVAFVGLIRLCDAIVYAGAEDDVALDEGRDDPTGHTVGIEEVAA